MACLIDCSWHVVDYRLAGVRSGNGRGIIDVDLFGLHELTLTQFVHLCIHTISFTSFDHMFLLRTCATIHTISTMSGSVSFVCPPEVGLVSMPLPPPHLWHVDGVEVIV